MSLRNIFLKLAHDVSRYPNIVQLTNTLDHGFKEVAAHIQDGGSEVEVTPVYTSGEKLATITVDDVDKDIYMPNGEVKTMEGSSFKTVNGSLVDEMKVGFTPIQDLHGYSKPWAGGAGKNLVGLDHSPAGSASTQHVTVSDKTDDTVTLTSDGSGTYSYYRIEYTLPAGLYTAQVKTESSDSYTPICVIYDPINTNLSGTIQEGTSRTFTLNAETTVNIRFFATTSDTTARTVRFYDFMLEKGSTATSYEPYSNICPISGHTQVQSKINDDTNTTALGGTEYDGEVDQVSGSGVSNMALLTFDGTENWQGNAGWNNHSFVLNNALTGAVSVSGYTTKANLLSNSGVVEAPADIVTSTWADEKQGVGQGDGTSLYVNLGSQFDTVTKFKNYLLANPLQVLYPLATPTALTLTGQNITAEVGENNVSAPGTNQEIMEVKYHQMMTIQDVEKMIQ